MTENSARSMRRQSHLRRIRERLDAEMGVDLGRVLDNTVLEHHADALDGLEIVGRIAGDEEEIGELAFLDRTQRLITAEILRHVRERCPARAVEACPENGGADPGRSV